MEINIQKTPIGLNILRWTARIFALLVVGLFLFQMFEASLKSPISFSNISFVSIATILVILCYLTALMIGFKWEATGGVMAIVCVVAHAMIIFTYATVPTSLLFFILPGLLYLLSWYLHKKYRNS